MVTIVYSTKTCPRCVQLKEALTKAGIAFENKDMGSTEAITELRINGVFTMSAPVLQSGDQFFTVEELFKGDLLVDLPSIIQGCKK